MCDPAMKMFVAMMRWNVSRSPRADQPPSNRIRSNLTPVAHTTTGAVTATPAPLAGRKLMTGPFNGFEGSGGML